MGRRASLAADRVVRESPGDSEPGTFLVDRGGQATVHNPGQLVIFPVMKISGIGVRNWVARLGQATENLSRRLGTEASWRPECSGLYLGGAKLASLGIRVRNGISTHGLSMNIRNNLEDFKMIRVCGVENAKMGHVHTDIPLEDVFDLWLKEFTQLS